jgi:hypothetical protein
MPLVRGKHEEPVRGIENVELFLCGLAHAPSVVVCDLIAMMLQLFGPLSWIVYQGLKLRPSDIDTVINSLGKVTAPTFSRSDSVETLERSCAVEKFAPRTWFARLDLGLTGTFPLFSSTQQGPPYCRHRRG